MQQLSLSDPKLLMWSEEDTVHPEATKLGADLLCAQEQFMEWSTDEVQNDINVLL